MPLRTKLLIVLVITAATTTVIFARHFHNDSWLEFTAFLVAILLSSGLKVALPQREGTMSLNFPFILLAIMQLSPLQAVLLAAISVAAQCRIKVKKLFTAVQIIFNIANVVSSTGCAFLAYTLLIRHGMALAPALAFGAAAYFFANTVPVAFAIAWTKQESPFALWKAEFPWYLPFYFVGAVIASVANWIELRFGTATAFLLIPVVYTVYRAYTAQIVRAKERQQHLEETEALHLRTIEGLAMAIEAKDQETHDHLFRVRNYVAAVGTAMHLAKDEMNALHTAALLHDIGKLAVPEHIINKPGKLTPEEFEKMKIHPVVGADILNRVHFPYPVVPIVRAHHEWWDGKGYPDGLQGEDIPIGARILTVVDCFDALTSDRPYRKGKSLEEAMEIVQSLAGTQFDPRVVHIFRKHCVELEHQVIHGEVRKFIPLNLEIEVWRGLAPGAGFEAQQSEVSGSLVTQLNLNQSDTDAASNSLSLIAAGIQEAQALFEMNQSRSGSLSPKETISILASRLRRLIPFDCCAFYLTQSDTVILQHVDGDHASCFSAQPVTLGDGISGWVAQSGKLILNGNAAVEPSYHKQTGEREMLKAALSMPMFDLQKNVFGVLTLYSCRADSFSREHARVLQVMESKLSHTIQKAMHLGRSESSMEIDALTGLPSANGLFVRLEKELNRSRRNSGALAVIVCDVNSFKNINERDGYLTGNEVLASLGDRFRQGCRPYDTIARMGGDEFVFLIADMVEADFVERLRSLVEIVSTPDASLKLTSELSASFGASFYPGDGDTAEDLLAAADRRMHLNKQAYYSAEASRTQYIQHSEDGTS